MGKKKYVLLSVVGMFGCGVIAMLEPLAQEAMAYVGFIFFGCAIIAKLELRKAERHRSS